MAISTDVNRAPDADVVGTSNVAPDARAAVVERLPGYAAELLATARFLVRTEADAQDLVQATLEQAIRHADDLRDVSRLRAWLIAIETREATRVRRRLARALHPPPFVAPQAQPPPDDVAVAIRAALADLPMRMRTALVLHHMVGLSVDETATAMSISANTARAHLKVGLRRMREMLR